MVKSQIDGQIESRAMVEMTAVIQALVKAMVKQSRPVRLTMVKHGLGASGEKREGCSGQVNGVLAY